MKESPPSRAASRLVYAEAGLSVALVEADVRRPTVSASLDVEAPDGLTEVIAGQITLRDAMHRVNYAGGHASMARTGVVDGGSATHAAEGGRLHVLPSGGEPPNPPVMLGSGQHAGRAQVARRATTTW